MKYSKPLKRVVVTGGAGQIAYSLLFRIARGELFGPDQPLALHLLEIPQAMQGLEGLKMELDDCAFPLLHEVHVGSDPFKIFEGAEFVFLVGATPRGPGMERGDLLSLNSKIFIEQGKALNDTASSQVKVLVVGNPCNTNCLIAMRHAPRIPKKNFHAMTRLDENRAKALLAQKAKAPVSAVTNMTIWGNHSSTQVPDYWHAKINGKNASEVIQDETWLQKEFIPMVQKRGAQVIAARGKSSAASAAHAAIEAMRSLLVPTPNGDWFSSGVYSEGNRYGIDPDLIYSFPCRSKGDGDYEIIQDLALNEFLTSRMIASENELKEERQLIK